MPNDFRGRGKIATGSYVLTTTGAIGPRDTGLASRTKVVGTIYMEDLKFGSDSLGCTYYWQYDDTTNDIIDCDSLQFGTAEQTVNADWIGTGAAPSGTNVLFTYSGTDPVNPSWTVVAPPGLRGSVSVDAPNDRVLLVLKIVPRGTVFRIR